LEAISTNSQQFPSDIAVLEAVLAWFNSLNKPGIPKKFWLQCELALAEGFTNAVRHAHKDLPPTATIEIEVSIFAERIEMKIRDSGPPFDLEARMRSLAVASQEATGGRGLAIMCKIADRLTYTREKDNRNCLYISKNCPPV